MAETAIRWIEMSWFDEWGLVTNLSIRLQPQHSDRQVYITNIIFSLTQKLN